MELTLADCDVTILSAETRNFLYNMWDSIKLYPSNYVGHQIMDWRRLAKFCELPSDLIDAISKESNPTERVLEEWFKKKGKGATCKLLLDYIEKFDQPIVFKTAEPLFQKDLHLQYYQNNRQDVKTLALDNPKLTASILTMDGLEPQFYNAVVLFADEDKNFAIELIEKMENLYGLKLFVKERDSMPDDGTVENDTNIIKLIAERCYRVVVILSQAFVQSEANKTLYRITESIAISQRSLKIIPCIYKDCGNLPSNYQYYCKLNFGSCVAGKFDMWAKLRDLLIPLGKTTQRTLLSQTRLELNNVVVPDHAQDDAPCNIWQQCFYINDNWFENCRQQNYCDMCDV